jgi:hypothetical protein
MDTKEPELNGLSNDINRLLKITPLFYIKKRL